MAEATHGEIATRNHQSLAQTTGETGLLWCSENSITSHSGILNSHSGIMMTRFPHGSVSVSTLHYMHHQTHLRRPGCGKPVRNVFVSQVTKYVKPEDLEHYVSGKGFTLMNVKCVSHTETKSDSYTASMLPYNILKRIYFNIISFVSLYLPLVIHFDKIKVCQIYSRPTVRSKACFNSKTIILYYECCFIGRCTL